ncbi:MAG: sugar transferase [Chloroflexi bacterium]|nr:sugar transferase [Chloroflexota bacterium]
MFLVYSTCYDVMSPLDLDNNQIAELDKETLIWQPFHPLCPWGGSLSSNPGITGWAQVNGRNDIGWEEKFALDLWYVDHQTLWLDLKILALTVWKVFIREGINQPGRASMEEFRGLEHRP